MECVEVSKRIRYGAYMTKEQIVRMLGRACQEAGGQARWAKLNDVSQAYISDVLAGKRDPGDKILAGLGIERIVTYRKKGPNQSIAA